MTNEEIVHQIIQKIESHCEVYPSHCHLTFSLIKEALNAKDAEIQEYKNTLQKLRIEGGMEKEIAKCFELVIERDKRIKELETAQSARVAEALKDCRVFLDEAADCSDCGAGLGELMNKVDKALANLPASSPQEANKLLEPCPICQSRTCCTVLNPARQESEEELNKIADEVLDSHSVCPYHDDPDIDCPGNYEEWWFSPECFKRKLMEALRGRGKGKGSV